VSEPGEKRALLVSKGWVQAAVVVFLIGFFVLGLLAYRTYTADPPIPDRVVDPGGRTLFTGDDIRDGQRVFLHNGLMEYGSIFGHGAYLGPDYTADYLHRAALSVERDYGGAGSDRAREQTIADFQANRYDSAARTLTYSDAQAGAFAELERHYADYFSNPTTELGLRPDAIDEHVRLIEAVFAQLHADRPVNIEYKVMRLQDGVSFVHVSTADTPDGSNPLPEMSAFREFGKDSAARVATTPVPTAADIIGSYHPTTPIGRPMASAD